MKILYLASGPIPSNAANSIHAVHMAASFGSLGHEVTVLAPSATLMNLYRRRSVARLYGVEERFSLLSAWYPKGPAGSKIYEAILLIVLRVVKPNLVYSRHLLGARISSGRGFSTVFEAHKPDWERTPKSRKLFNNLLGSQSLVGLVSITQALENYVKESFALAPGKTFVAPDAGFNRSLTIRKSRSSPFVVGYFGSLLPGKGLDSILSIAPHCPSATFMVVGGTAKEISHIRKSLNIPRNVSLHQRLPHSCIQATMAGCDVLIAPYSENVETFGGGADVAQWMSPLKLFEYMSVKKPIVCSDLPVLREVLEHEISALLVGPGDIEGWAQAIKRLRNDGELGERLATTALEAFQKQHTWHERARRILAWLQADSNPAFANAR